MMFFKLHSRVFFGVITGANGTMMETAGKNWTLAIVSRLGVDVSRFIEINFLQALLPGKQPVSVIIKLMNFNPGDNNVISQG